jgi:hypothetical protein
MSKRKKQKSKTGSDFLTLLIVIAILGAGYWYWQNKNARPIRHTAKRPVIVPASKPISETKTKDSPSPETQAASSAKSLTTLFPKEAWLDDYLQTQAHLENSGKTDLLVAIGLAPRGVNPDQIRNPERLHPSILVARKEGDQYSKLDEFDFSTPQPTEAGIQGSDLTGLPRITADRLVDLDGDGRPELMVSLDTHGEWTEAIAFLKWENGHLRWIKTRNHSGAEKIALWLTGSTPSESQEITLNKAQGHSEVIQKKGQIDSAHPGQGFVWKTTVWEMKGGFLQER